MKIAFIHPRWPGAEGTGAIHSATKIIEGLLENGHDVTAFCLDEPSSAKEVPANIDTRFLSMGGFPYQRHLQVNKALKDLTSDIAEYDLVHSYIMSTIPALQHFGKNTSTSTITTLNSYGGACAKGNARYMDRESCSTNGIVRCLRCALSTIPDHESFPDNLYTISKRVTNIKLIQDARSELDVIDGYHALSPHVRSRYADFGFPSEKIQVIPNILDEDFLVEHTSTFEEPYKLIHVGYFHRQKGADRLVPLIDSLHSDAPNSYELSLVGDGPLRTELESEVSRRGLSKIVEFHGHVDNFEIPQLLASHDIFVYPGRWDEPFGRVYLEAMAAGTPVISTDIGSAEKILGDGGVVVGNNIRDLVSGVKRVVNDDQLEAMSSVAVENAKEYRSCNVIPKFEKLYADCLETYDAF